MQLRPGQHRLLIPVAGGGLAHLWRDNDNLTMPWSDPFLFGQGLGHVDGVTLIQSNCGSPGNLELIATAGGRLRLFWRGSAPSFTWSGPDGLIATTW